MNKYLFSVAAGLFLAATVNSCTQNTAEVEETVTEFNLETAKAEIEDANLNFMELFAKGDSVGLANAYTADGKMMATGTPAVVGTADLVKAWNEMIHTGLTKVDLKLENIYGNEDLLAEEGVATLFVDEDTVGIEKYIVLWKKEDGKWKMFRDIFNSNLPLE